MSNETTFYVKVLSTGYEHLYKTSWQDAMTSIFTGRMEVVEEHPSRVITTVNGFLPMPTVVRFVKGVFMNALNRPSKAKKPHRKNIFLRDNGRCQYCDKKLTYESSTLDHVVPRSMGGKNTWENLVLCCSHCNTLKSNRTLHECGLSLKTKPILPSYFCGRSTEDIILRRNKKSR